MNEQRKTVTDMSVVLQWVSVLFYARGTCDFDTKFIGSLEASSISRQLFTHKLNTESNNTLHFPTSNCTLRPFSHWGDATAIRLKEKTLYSRLLDEPSVRNGASPIGVTAMRWRLAMNSVKPTFFLIESQSRRLNGRKAELFILPSSKLSFCVIAFFLFV
jgi:hypothetical protein